MLFDLQGSKQFPLGLAAQAMGSFLVFTTLLCVWLPVHLYLSKADFVELPEWIAWAKKHVDEVKTLRMKEEMMKVRISNFKLQSRLCSYCCVLGGCLFWRQAYEAPSFQNIIWATATLAIYIQHSMVANSFIELTPHRIKFFTRALHVLLLFLSITSATAESTFDFVLKIILLTSVRFLVVFTCLDPWTTIPFQLVYSMADTTICFFFFEESYVHWTLLCFVQICILVNIITCSLLVDVALQGLIYTFLDTADAESLVSSFRRVLRGVCDGEVLLDSSMMVVQESQCLKNLILTDVSLIGRCFLHLLADGDRDRFRSFIESSMQAVAMPDSKHVAPPFCSRVMFRGSTGLRVSADIYHVPVPGLFGAKEAHHLIALKEDLESRPLPEAEEGSLPSQLLWRQTSHSYFGTDTASESSGQGNMDASPGCPDLEEMTLLVSVGTELQDVLEAHVRFERREEVGDIPSALQSSMPSLRKLVKPTDWENIRSEVLHFAARAADDPAIPAKVMKKLAVQLPGQRGWLVAEDAALNPCPTASLVP